MLDRKQADAAADALMSEQCAAQSATAQNQAAAARRLTAQRRVARLGPRGHGHWLCHRIPRLWRVVPKCCRWLWAWRGYRLVAGRPSGLTIH